MPTFTPRLVTVDDSRVGGEFAASVIGEALTADPRGSLGVATGSTPLSTWDALRERGEVIDRTLVALDEYVGLPADHPESYASVIRRDIAGPLDIPADRVVVPGVDKGGVAGSAFEHELVAHGGVAVQVLGIGRNGHIAFNEPGSSLTSRTRLVRLSDVTRTDNARNFGAVDDVPRLAVTQGIGTILRARTLVLLAWGRTKAAALDAALAGPITARVPASAVRLHPRCTIVADVDAASAFRHRLGLSRRDR